MKSCKSILHVCVHVCVSEAELEKIPTLILRGLYMAIYYIIKLIRGKTQNPDVLAVLDKLQQRLEGDDAGPTRVKMKQFK